MIKGISTPNEIISFCGVSFAAASYAGRNIANRKKKLGAKLLSYEREFIEKLDPIALWVYELIEKED